MEAIERDSNRDLPQELLIEIITRLPVKSLVKFRCVCKSWYSLIKSPKFASNHFNTFTNNNNNNNNNYLLTLETPDPYHEIQTSLRCGDDFETIGDIGLGFLYYEEFDVVGYVNGVICLKFVSNYELLQIRLSNPSIRKSVILPLPEMAKFQSGKSRSLFLDIGFGFDVVKNEYKLLAIGYPCTELNEGAYEFSRNPKMLEVFAPSVGSWRSISVGSVPENVAWRWDSPKLFLNGAVHLGGNDWVSGRSCAHLIAFDMSTEVFSYMELPHSGEKGEAISRFPLVYGQSLGLMEVFPVDQMCLWVMKDYGVRESWVREYKISPSLSFRGFVHLKKDDHVIFVSPFNPNLIVCNGNHQNDMRCCLVDKFDYHAINEMCLTDTYVESLFLLGD